MVGARVGIAAAAAAADARRREEEDMTAYTHGELADGWEFKILRSPTGRFHDSATLRTVLEEERQGGGWVMVEKFDDFRIRLKRPADSKALQGDFADGYDPYRTILPPTQGAVAAAVAVCAMLAVGCVVLVLVLIVG